jgi:hypothetical protein
VHLRELFELAVVVLEREVGESLAPAELARGDIICLRRRGHTSHSLALAHTVGAFFHTLIYTFLPTTFYTVSVMLVHYKIASRVACWGGMFRPVHTQGRHQEGLYQPLATALRRDYWEKSQSLDPEPYMC